MHLLYTVLYTLYTYSVYHTPYVGRVHCPSKLASITPIQMRVLCASYCTLYSCGIHSTLNTVRPA